ncbi:MAG: tetratricopeptide repeat protein [Bacteroidales bacterium]|jgi:tetratricopeptide (TPR) repeat protein|nr:tetratricopeptide repeat protein [Bacteroidales bacterium]MCI1732915.1 tetratricopeptide repeat protein [Bacteroidales bacterium]
MKRINTFLMTLALALFVSAGAFAQDMTAATEAFNKAKDAFTAGNETEAVTGFNEAMKLATAAGEEGKQMVSDCKDIIPKILLQAATKKLDAKDYAGALAGLEATVAKAKEYGGTETAESAGDLIPQITMMLGDNALNAKNFTEAVAKYKETLEYTPSDGNAYLRLGMAYAASGDEASAEDAFTKAKDNGQADAANKQLSTMYFNKLASAFQAKNYSAAVAAAEKVNSFGTNAQASLYGGMAAANMKSYAKAISLLKKAQQNSTTFYYLATCYEKSGSTPNACAYYKRILTDKQFGAFAKSKIAALKCK